MSEQKKPITSLPESDVDDDSFIFQLLVAETTKQKGIDEPTKQRRLALMNGIAKALVEDDLIVKRKVLASLYSGPKRFSELRKLVTLTMEEGEKDELIVSMSTSAPTLSKTLDALEEQGRVTKTEKILHRPQYRLTDSQNPDVKIWGIIKSEDETFNDTVEILINLFDYSETIVSLSSKRDLLIARSEMIQRVLRNSASRADVESVIHYAIDQQAFRDMIQQKVKNVIQNLYEELNRTLTLLQRVAIYPNGLSDPQESVSRIVELLPATQPLMLYVLLATWLGKEIYAKANLDVAELDSWVSSHVLVAL